MTTSDTPARRSRAKRRYRFWRLARANFYDLLLLLRESWVVLAAFALLALAGTCYLRYFYSGPDRPPSLAAALFETLKLVAFQTGYALPADPIGAALFFLIPLFGLALIFQSVLNFGRLLLDKGSRREAWQVALAATYRDHVIVCGLGRVGLRLVTQLLEAGYEPIVIEREWSSEFVARALNLKVPVVLGDAREAATLRQAGLLRARAVAGAISDDLSNIEIALTARAARPGIRVVLRAFGEELDQNLERAFGPNSAFSASALAAPTFAAAAVSREVDYILPSGEALLGVAQLTIEPDSQLAGFVRAIEEQHDIRVLRHQDAGGRLVPRELMRQLSSGDRVMLFGALPALESLRLKNVRGSKFGFLKPLPLQHPTEQFDTVIVCGLGKVGYRVVGQLHRMRPRPRVVVIHMDDGPAEFTRRIGRLSDVTLLVGDARDPNVLRKAGIARAYTVAALTSDDLLNLQVGLAARRERADIHVVLRVFSDTLAQKLEDMFGIRTIYSTSGLAAPTLAAAALLGDISHAFFTDGELFSIDRLVVREGEPFSGQTVDAIRAQHSALPIALRRDGETWALPPLDTALAPGDEISLLATVEALARVRALMARRPSGESQALPSRVGREKA